MDLRLQALLEQRSWQKRLQVRLRCTKLRAVLCCRHSIILVKQLHST